MKKNKIAVVVGGSRGLGQGAVEALLSNGYRVLSISRYPSIEGSHHDLLEVVNGDATDDDFAYRILDGRKPDLVLLCAGNTTSNRPFYLQTWQSFSQNWEVDTQITFVWLRNAMLLQMKNAHFVVVSSMAAVRGSPVSGGYAGAKKMQWLLTEYAQEEIERNQLSLKVHCVLPVLNPSTAFGRAAIEAYAEREGVPYETFKEHFLPALTPEMFGKSVIDLHENPNQWTDTAYQVSAKGLSSLPQSSA